MREILFSGVCTALVTPFLDDKVNLPMLEQLLYRQMKYGIRTIVLNGTTGESATLHDNEKIEIIEKARNVVKDQCMLIAGTGSNSTEHAIALSVAAEKAGADALLIVSPYYNKATPEGLYMHYKTIAESVSLPIILYNVPSRTGVDIPVEVYQKLSVIPNISGVKEATSDLKKILAIRSVCPNNFGVWCGNDDLAVPFLASGANGVISVISNILPNEMGELVSAALDGDFDTALSLQLALGPLIEFLFCEVNPIPVKAALKKIGYDCGGCRLPLTSLSQSNQEHLKQFFK